MVGLVAFVLAIFIAPVRAYAGAAPVGLVGFKAFSGDGGGILLKTSPLAIFTVFLYIFGAFAAFTWSFADILDRQKRFVWLLPLFICPMMGLYVFPFGLYLFFGRETPAPDQNVK